jgi:hypothetical protein
MRILDRCVFEKICPEIPPFPPLSKGGEVFEGNPMNIARPFPLLKRGRCEEIDLVLFHVIPAKAGIQYFNGLRTYWTPVFTGVTTKNHFFQTFRG